MLKSIETYGFSVPSGESYSSLLASGSAKTGMSWVLSEAAALEEESMSSEVGKEVIFSSGNVDFSETSSYFSTGTLTTNEVVTSES